MYAYICYLGRACWSAVCQCSPSLAESRGRKAGAQYHNHIYVVNVYIYRHRYVEVYTMHA